MPLKVGIYWCCLISLSPILWMKNILSIWNAFFYKFPNNSPLHSREVILHPFLLPRFFHKLHTSSLVNWSRLARNCRLPVLLSLRHRVTDPTDIVRHHIFPFLLHPIHKQHVQLIMWDFVFILFSETLNKGANPFLCCSLWHSFFLSYQIRSNVFHPIIFCRSIVTLVLIFTVFVITWTIQVVITKRCGHIEFVCVWQRAEWQSCFGTEIRRQPGDKTDNLPENPRHIFNSILVISSLSFPGKSLYFVSILI